MTILRGKPVPGSFRRKSFSNFLFTSFGISTLRKILTFIRFQQSKLCHYTYHLTLSLTTPTRGYTTLFPITGDWCTIISATASLPLISYLQSLKDEKNLFLLAHYRPVFQIYSPSSIPGQILHSGFLSRFSSSLSSSFR